ncbi:TolC family protein [Catalinimonas niigatensis]|uniref:TolC family protein n=1 Tax=Catalinimonas niigatensis TaxID=1397264 RepID=UPI002665725F|nr:TolC family protein [Catalinimonas niigatensis]WPP52644.1 TolC family protein [Catalinimonas niigatensis]
MTTAIKTLAFALFSVFFYANSSHAQSGGSEEPLILSLQESIDRAIRNNISVKQTELQVVGSQVTLKQSKAELLPSLNANTGISYSVGRTINQFTNEYVDQPVRQQSMGLSTQLTLFNGLQRLNTIKQNKVNLEGSQYDLEASKDAVTLNVIQAYTQILFNIELLENAEFQLRTSSSQLQRTEKLVTAGSLPIANQLELEAQQANNELSVVNAENDLELAYLNLKQLLQLPESQEIDIVIPDVEEPSEFTLPASAAEVYETAAQQWANLQSAELQVNSARYGLAIARGAYYPSLALSAGIFSQYSSIAPDQIPRAGTENVTTVIPTGDFLQVPDGLIPDLPAGTRIPVLTETQIPSEFTDNTYLNQLDFNLRRFISIDLSIPIFNNWRVRSNVANAQLNLESNRLEVINQRNQLRQTIEQVYLDAKAATKSFSASERQVSSLKEAFRNTEIRYQVGAIDAVEFNLSQNNLNIAESDLIRAKYNYIFSIKVLDFYQGNPLDF